MVNYQGYFVVKTTSLLPYKDTKKIRDHQRKQQVFSLYLGLFRVFGVL